MFYPNNYNYPSMNVLLAEKKLAEMEAMREARQSKPQTAANGICVLGLPVQRCHITWAALAVNFILLLIIIKLLQK